MTWKRQNHTITEQDLHAFVDGELDGQRYRTVIAHLAANPDAADRVNGFLRQHSELVALREELADLDPLPHERTEVLARELACAMRHQRRTRLSLASSGLVVTLLVGLVSLWGPNPREVAEHLSWTSSVDAGGGPHVLFGRDPLGAAQQSVTSESNESTFLWLDQQLAANAMQRPDFGAYGLRFVGGNSLQSGETPAVRLVYEDEEGNTVFLFVGAVGSSGDVALTLVPEGHISLNWRRGSLVFALIGPKESEQLLAAMRDAGEFLMPAPGLMPDEAEPETAEATTPAPRSESVVRRAVLPGAGEGTTLMNGSGGTADATPSPLPASPQSLNENKRKSL